MFSITSFDVSHMVNGIHFRLIDSNCHEEQYNQLFFTDDKFILMVTYINEKKTLT